MRSTLLAILIATLVLGSATLARAQHADEEPHGDEDSHKDEGGVHSDEKEHHDDEGGHSDEEGHHADESASEHLVELYGGEGVVYEPELKVMFQELNDACTHEDHDHAHAGHKHEDAVITPLMLVEEFGRDGALDSEGLEHACSTILRCQLESGCELKSDVHGDDHDGEDNVRGLKLVAAAVLLAEAIVGAMVPLVVGHFKKFNFWLSILNSFAGGVFLSTGFTHMLPHIEETESEVKGLDEYPLGSVILVIGFMIVFFVERIIFDVHTSVDTVFRSDGQEVESKSIHLEDGAVAPSQNKQGPTEAEKKWARMANPIILLLAISVHAVLEALALGLEEHRNGVLILFASIGSHKGVAAMALAARFIRNGATKKQVLGFMAGFSVIAPIGILIGMASSDVDPLVHLILSGLAAGTFIYVGAYEVIAEEFHGRHISNGAKQIKYLAVAMGVLVISLLQLVPHEEH
ncbi:hypothetical protein BSKO_13194 [Bryopsis sp. KO-2023]|nr:hypothetical protein BSKO_13194 [Bryopsis sp. KO-2023]